MLLFRSQVSPARNLLCRRSKTADFSRESPRFGMTRSSKFSWRKFRSLTAIPSLRRPATFWRLTINECTDRQSPAAVSQNVSSLSIAVSNPLITGSRKISESQSFTHPQGCAAGGEHLFCRKSQTIGKIQGDKLAQELNLESRLYQAGANLARGITAAMLCGLVKITPEGIDAPGPA